MRRCHPSTFGATEFNPLARTPGRFRPIRRGGRIVPTLYGADESSGAISETVFHDVPIDASLKLVRLGRFEIALISTIAPKRDLTLVRLHGNGFHRVRASRAQLIESEATSYPQLAAWGQALHDCPIKPDGLIWRSRHFDDAYACLVFGHRLRRVELEVVEPSLPLIIGRGLELVEEIAEEAGITLVS